MRPLAVRASVATLRCAWDETLARPGAALWLTGGKTQIKGGYTYSRFETVPDAPISTFETTLPEGVHSALAAVLPGNSYNLCSQALQMPTTIVAQNGAQITQTTKVGVTGCGKAKPRKKASAACRKKKGKARRACEARARRRKRGK